MVWTFTASTLSARVRQGDLAHHWRNPTAEEKEAGANGAKDFYERVQILDDAGALEWVYYLAEDATEDATLIYPAGVKRNGKMVWSELEAVVGGYAIRAACALGGYSNQAPEWEDRAPNRFILPADRMARQATLVGVPRLRHRARTANASRWRQELVDNAQGIVATFRGIIAEHAPALLDEPDRRFADFNGASISTVLQWRVQLLINVTSTIPLSRVQPIPLLTERPTKTSFRAHPMRMTHMVVEKSLATR